MRLHPRSVLQVHDLYHRKEGEGYVIGDPETGNHLTITAAELRVLRMLAGGLELARVEELAREEQDRVDVNAFVRILARKGLVHTVDGKVITHKHEPLHELYLEPTWIASPTVHYLLLITAVAGVFTLAWRGVIPGAAAFFLHESLLLTVLTATTVLWALVFFRQLAKHGHARALGLQSRFGLANHQHWFVPKTFHAPATEEQEHKILASGLLTITALVMAAAMVATYTGKPFWYLVFLVGIIELIAECMLFLDTDLAKYIGFRVRIHQLNRQTKELLIDDLKALVSGTSKPAHTKITGYAFLYLLSLVLAVIVLAVYIVPIAVGVVVTALERLTITSPWFADAVTTLALLSFELFLYGLATLKRHPLAHNAFFVNTSLAAIVAASFLLATVTTAWTDAARDLFLAALVLYATGLVLALVFERAVTLAHPFADFHTVYETTILPMVAAFVPMSVLFTLPGDPRYFHAAVLAIGMLTAIALLEMRRVATANRTDVPLRS